MGKALIKYNDLITQHNKEFEDMKKQNLQAITDILDSFYKKIILKRLDTGQESNVTSFISFELTARGHWKIGYKFNNSHTTYTSLLQNMNPKRVALLLDTLNKHKNG